MAASSYCTQQDIINRIGEEALATFTEDIGWTEGVADCISEASSVIDEYLLPHYAPEGMATNRWVRQRCAWLAAGLLMERRGNAMPGPMLRRLEKIEKKLEEAAAGKMQVPGLVRRRTSVPTLSNPRVVLGSGGPRVVVSRWRGTRRPAPVDYVQPPDPGEMPPPTGGGF